MSDTTTVLIVGAGFAGLGTAIRLLQRGIDDFVLLEPAGTWRDNTYPGAACDIPSRALPEYGRCAGSSFWSKAVGRVRMSPAPSMAPRFHRARWAVARVL